MDKKHYILVVDDMATNLKYAEELLKEKFKVAFAKSGAQALKFLERNMPDLILLDINMPEMDGYETIAKIKADTRTSGIPVIFLTGQNENGTELKGFRCGASDFIAKPFEAEVVLSRINRILELEDLRRNLEIKVKNQTEQIEKMSLQAVTVIANIVDDKDKFARGHSVKVAECSIEIAKRLGFERNEVLNVYHMALLHDIGKICIPDSILSKPAKLSKEEYEIVKKHTVVGNGILKDVQMIKNASMVALYHHERYDGTGYNGLKGEEIPIEARIVSIADAYIAMTSDRAYRAKLTDEQVKVEFTEQRGKQFDPKLVDIMLVILEEGYEKEEIIDDDSNNEFATESGIILQKVLNGYTKEIQAVAQKDVLTGLWNRRYTEDEVNIYLRDARHAGCLLMVDMDNFKGINDTFGHITGDETLIAFSDTLRQCTRYDDIVCRVGGDEFIIFLKELFLYKDIEEKAREILIALRKKLITPDGQNVSVSMGIAVSPDDGRDFLSLYQNADRALYFVKQNGKDSYHFYENDKSINLHRNTRGDLEHLKKIMAEGGQKNGVYCVESEGFKKIYQFVERFIERTKQSVQIVLLTLNDANENFPKLEYLETAIFNLKQAINMTLRKGDVATNYSSSQYIVILMDADYENGCKVADRIKETYSQLYVNDEVALRYDIQEINTER